MRRAAALASVALALGLLACTKPEPPGAVRLQVENATDTPVGVYVNDTWIGTDEPGATISSELPPTETSSYRIEARSPSGTVLAAFDAPAIPVQALREGRGAPLGEIVPVPCGEITILIGELAADEALVGGPPVEPGPCP